MKRNRLFASVNNLGYNHFFVIAMVLFSSLAIAQTPVNMSGKWAFDISKSDPGKGGSFPYGDITYNITQNSTSISMEEITKRPGAETITTIETFSLDGKAILEKGDYGLTKRTAKWSEDKKNLILTTIMTVDSKDYCDDATYILSDEALKLTVQHKFRNPMGESSVIQVFNKKK